MPHYRLYIFGRSRNCRRTIELDLPSDDEVVRAVTEYVTGPAMLLCEDGRIVARFPPRSYHQRSLHARPPDPARF